MLIMRGPEFMGGIARDELVSQIDIFPTICEVARIDPPSWLEGRSLVGLVNGSEPPGAHRRSFPSSPTDAAYEPQRAIRTERASRYVRRFDEYPYPVLANCDDSPSKGGLPGSGAGPLSPLPVSGFTTSSSTPVRVGTRSMIPTTPRWPSIFAPASRPGCSAPATPS